VNGSLGGIFYVVFWCVFFHFILSLVQRRISVGIICIGVLITTCSLEFLQLVKTPLLFQIRSTYMGQILMGTTFVPSDFIYYFAGAAIAWFLLKKISPI